MFRVKKLKTFAQHNKAESANECEEKKLLLLSKLKVRNFNARLQFTELNSH